MKKTVWNMPFGHVAFLLLLMAGFVFATMQSGKGWLRAADGPGIPVFFGACAATCLLFAVIGFIGSYLEHTKR